MNPILRAETDPLATAFNIKELFSSTLNPLRLSDADYRSGDRRLPVFHL
jgi:hypothetical protein